MTPAAQKNRHMNRITIYAPRMVIGGLPALTDEKVEKKDFPRVGK